MIGIDLVANDRIKLDKPYIHYLLTEHEYTEYTQLPQNQKVQYIASHLASKEAIFKATQDPNYLQYTIAHHENGQPYVLDHPQLHLSISHDGGYTIAICLSL